MSKKRKFFNKYLNKRNLTNESEIQLVEPKLEDMLSNNVVNKSDEDNNVEDSITNNIKKGILSTVLTHSMDNSNILELNMNEKILKTEFNLNPFLKEIPVLTEVVDNIDNILETKEIPNNKDISSCLTKGNLNQNNIVDFSTLPVIEYMELTLSMLEKSIHERVLVSYQKKTIQGYKEFWLTLYHLKSQGLFNQSYYITWLINWLGSTEKEKLQVLCFPFIWRDICELSDGQIFELVKPSLNALYQFKDMDLIFSLLEALSLANVYLPHSWLEKYLRFDKIQDGGVPKNFMSILTRNKNSNRT